jgi:TPR repeat protein
VPQIISDESFRLRLTEDAKCQTDLGIAYFRQKNYSDAAKRFAKVAEQGH